MKILLISNMYPSEKFPVYGIFVKNFENSIIRNNGIIYKSVIKGRGLNLFEKILKYAIFYLSVFKNVIIKDYDLIYVHYTTHSMLPLVLIGDLIRKPLVVNAHGDDMIPTTKLSKLIHNLTSQSVTKSTMLVVPSLFFKELALVKYKHKNIFISPSGGVNLDIFRKMEINNKVPNKLTIGYISRIDHGKGWDIYLKSLSLINEQYINIDFTAIIVGHGNQVKNMEHMVKSLKLEHKVQYIGKLPQSELPLVFNSLDVFIFPTTLHESLGLVGLESMACGTPVIGSLIGGIPEYIKNSFNGYLFTPGDYDDLARKIFDFYNLTVNEKNMMIQNALNTAEQFNSCKVGQDLYDKMITLISK